MSDNTSSFIWCVPFFAPTKKIQRLVFAREKYSKKKKRNQNNYASPEQEKKRRNRRKSDWTAEEDIIEKRKEKKRIVVCFIRFVVLLLLPYLTNRGSDSDKESKSERIDFLKESGLEKRPNSGQRENLVTGWKTWLDYHTQTHSHI